MLEEKDIVEFLELTGASECPPVEIAPDDTPKSLYRKARKAFAEFKGARPGSIKLVSKSAEVLTEIPTGGNSTITAVELTPELQFIELFNSLGPRCRVRKSRMPAHALSLFPLPEGNLHVDYRQKSPMWLNREEASLNLENIDEFVGTFFRATIQFVLPRHKECQEPVYKAEFRIFDGSTKFFCNIFLDQILQMNAGRDISTSFPDGSIPESVFGKSGHKWVLKSHTLPLFNLIVEDYTVRWIPLTRKTIIEVKHPKYSIDF